MSLFSTKHYSADNLANKCNLASADDRASADDLEIQYHLASADNLESRHKQTADHATKPTNPERLCPREAVKFNDQGNRAAASNLGIRKTRRPPLRLTALLGSIMLPSSTCTPDTLE